MRMAPRVLVAAGSVAVVAAVNLLAAVHASGSVRIWVLGCALLATAAAVQSAAWDPADLGAAMMFSVPGGVALIADGSPTWLLAPLAAALLFAGELNALSWQLAGATALHAARRRRLLDAARLAAFGLAAAAAALAVGAIARAIAPSGLAAMLIGASALTGVGRLVFPRQLVFRRGRPRT